jgi:hypothetical protein
LVLVIPDNSIRVSEQQETTNGKPPEEVIKIPNNVLDSLRDCVNAFRGLLSRAP